MSETITLSDAQRNSIKTCALQIIDWHNKTKSETGSRCAWLEYTFSGGMEIRVYVRNEWAHRKFTIGNIEVTPRGIGIGRELLMWLEYELPNGFTIENVLNRRFDLFLQRRGGYKRTTVAGIPSFAWTGEP